MAESDSVENTEGTTAKPDEPSAPKAPEPVAEKEPAGSTDSPATTEPPAGTEPAVKPKKKKKRKREKEATEPSRDPLGPDGRERPAFVLDYPRDPELDRLVQAFELGNYAFVREHAPELAKKAGDSRVREAAAELTRRIEPDPLVKVLLAMSIALFLVLAFWAYKTHGN
jgi:hypothetical protein